jgi:hypothetical protein
MRIHQSFFVAGVVALSVGVYSLGTSLTAQTVSTPGAVSPLAAQQQLRARFHLLRQRTATSHSGWERGFWLRGQVLAADYADRTAFVRFLRTELVPVPTSDGQSIAGLVERLDAAARSADARGFQENASALSVIVDNAFATSYGGMAGR